MADEVFHTRDLIELVKAVESLSAMQNILREDVQRLNVLIKEGSGKPSMLQDISSVQQCVDAISLDIRDLREKLDTIKQDYMIADEMTMTRINEKIDIAIQPLNTEIQRMKEVKGINKKDRKEWEKLVVSFLLGAGLQILVLFLTGVI